MQTIATLGPSVRLVILKFLMKNELVPAVVPAKRTPTTPPLPPVKGKEVLASTPGVDICSLVNMVTFSDNYELVDVWKKPHDRRMSFVQFMYCRKEYVERDGLFPEFAAKRDELMATLVSLATDNLWATQGHLNPHFNKDGSATGHQVLMFGCAGRKPDTEVYQGGRDPLTKQGIGPKVLLSTLAPRLDLQGAEVVLLPPEPVCITAGQ